MIHAGPHDTALIGNLVIALALAALFLLYWVAAARQRRRGRHWSDWRVAAFGLSLLLLGLGLLPPLSGLAHQSLRGHMLQHLLLGMFAPLGLVLAAPVNLALRSAPPGYARRCVRLFNNRPLRLLRHPLSAFWFSTGGLYLLYLTPLYAATLQQPLLHAWMLLHLIFAGCLFTWVIAGPVPGPRRPSAGTRLLLLFLAMGAHACLAKIMYAYHWPRAPGFTLEDVRAAAQWMYYGGDLAELLLLVALLAGSRREFRRLAHRLSGAAP